jgi:hypothetical protein
MTDVTSGAGYPTLPEHLSCYSVTGYQGNPDRNHNLWDIVSTEMYMRIYSISSCE